ncbi:hypothetical protein LINPERPRIM_LOCUS36957 [Linum perenne]
MGRSLVIPTRKPRVTLSEITFAHRSLPLALIWGPALLCARSCRQQRWLSGLLGTWG